MHLASDEDWQIADTHADDVFWSTKAEKQRFNAECRATELAKLVKIHASRKAAGFESKVQAEEDETRRQSELDKLKQRHEQEKMFEEEQICWLSDRLYISKEEKINRLKERYFQFQSNKSESLDRLQIAALRGKSIQAILNLLKKERKSRAIQLAGFVQIIQLTHHNVEECEKAGERLFAASGIKTENGCECVVNSLREHLLESIIVEKGLAVIGNLCLHQPNSPKLAAAGAMELVLACSSTFLFNPSIQKQVCYAISELCLTSEDNFKTAVDLSAIDNVFSVLQRWGKEPSNATEACRAVLVLLSESDELVQRALDLGLSSWVMEELTQNAASVETSRWQIIFDRLSGVVPIRNALKVMTILVASGEQLYEENLIAILSCLRGSQTDALVSLYTLQLIHCCLSKDHPYSELQRSRIAAFEKEALDDGVMAACVSCMNKHPKLGNIHWQACALMVLLIETDAKLSSVYRRVEGLLVVGKGLKENTHLPPVLEQYCRLIALTGTNVVDRSTYCSAGLQCPQLIQKLLYVHRNHLGVQHFGRIALTALLGRK